MIQRNDHGGLPRVSVVMAVHNGGTGLLASLRSVLVQTLQNLELIVVDDGSTDQTAQVLRGCDDPRLTVLTQPVSLGPARSLMRGIDVARAPYVAHLLAGDVCHPSRLQTQAEVLDSRPELTLLGSWYARVDDRGRVVGHVRPPTDPAPLAWSLCWANPIHFSTVMLRRRMVLAAGGYDPSLGLAADDELWTRLVMLGHRLAGTPQPLVRCRGESDAAPLGREVEHRAAQWHIRQRYQCWQFDQVAPAMSMRLLEAIVQQRPLPGLGGGLSATQAMQASWAAWQERIPTCIADQLQRHIAEVLMAAARRAPRDDAATTAALLLRALAIRPVVAWQGECWRLACRLARATTMSAARGVGPALGRMLDLLRDPDHQRLLGGHRRRIARRVAEHERLVQAWRRDPFIGQARRPLVALAQVTIHGDPAATRSALVRLRCEHPEAFLVACVHDSWALPLRQHPEVDAVLAMSCYGELAALQRHDLFDRVLDLNGPGSGCDRCGCHATQRVGDEGDLATVGRLARWSVPWARVGAEKPARG